MMILTAEFTYTKTFDLRSHIAEGMSEVSSIYSWVIDDVLRIIQGR